MVSKGRHPKNPINDALDEIDQGQFNIVEVHKGHRWGKVVCRECEADIQIWGSPKVPEDNANQIRRFCKRHQQH